MTRFSDEEKSIIGMYNTADRVGLIVKIKEAIPYIEDADLKDTAADIISKLVVMTDKEFVDLEDFVNFWDYGEQCKKDNKAVFLDSYGVLENSGSEFTERYSGDLNTIPKEYSITTDALSEIEIEDSMGLTVRIDEYSGIRELNSVCLAF